MMIRSAKAKQSSSQPSRLDSTKTKNPQESPAATVRHVSRHPQADILLKVTINGTKYIVDPDSGSDINLCDKKHFKEINTNGQLTLKPVKKNVQGVTGHKIDIFAKFTAQISSPTKL